MTRHTMPLLGPVRLFADDLEDKESGDVELLTNSGTIKFIQEYSDLPSPVGGVITLEDETTYFFTTTVDLLGDRIVGGVNTTILGGSSENCRIKSTGLTASALITSSYSLPIRGITLEADIALNLNGDGVTMALDWFGVNLTNCPTVGTIANYTNVIFSDCSMLGSANLTFSGSIGTVGINQALISGLAGQTSIIVDASAVISRRFRIIYSAFSTPATGLGLSISDTASIPAESYILDTVNFSGAGTAISGVNQASNKALFVSCKGIANTFVNGHYYMQNNATATVVGATNTYYKIAGTSTAGSGNSRFTPSSNRLTSDTVISRKFLVMCTLSFTAGANNVCRFGVYSSTAGGVRVESTASATANSAGRAESVTLQDNLELSSGEYIEIHAASTSATTNITVTDFSVTVTEI